MPYRLTVRRKAESDIDAALALYESQEPSVGVRFLREIDSAIDLITNQPELFAPVHRDIRRAILNKFPFGIFYVYCRNLIS